MSGLPKKKGKPGRNRELSERHKRFVEEYLVDLNAGRAAREAGYRNPLMGNELLKSKVYPLIGAAIREGMERKRKSGRVTAERLMEEIAKIALFNPKRLVTEEGAPIPLAELPDEVAAAIREVEIVTRTSEDGETRTEARVKLWDKMEAINLLAKVLGLVKEKGGAEPNVLVVALDDLYRRSREKYGAKGEPDLLEARIKKVEATEVKE